jgi:lipoprotein-anchoring transpeptidase ErfK/SrfK
LQSVWAQAVSKLIEGGTMKTLNLSKAAMMATIAVALAAQARSQSSTTTAASQPALAASAPRRVIVVSLEDHKLALVEDGQVKKVYPVAVGKPSTPSPTGTFTIERRVVNPTYSHNGKTVLPGPHNPVGTRWMGLSKHGYGIHGTNEPNSIGKAASHGCIRMAKADLEEFYTLVAVGDTVELVGERNEETAQLFGAPQTPAVIAAQPATAVAAATVPAPAASQQTADGAKAAAAPALATLAALR